MDLSSSVRRATVIAVLIMGCVAVATALTMRLPRDFAVYMRGADRIVHGQQIYRTDDEAAFTYPPFFALPYTPLLLFGPRVQLFLWSLTNCALLIITLRLVANWVRPQILAGVAKNGPKSSWIWLAVAVLSGRFLISPLEYQAHDLIVLVLVLLGGMALSSQRQSWAGFGFGLAAACKATPLLFLPILVMQRRWRACASLLAVLIAATLLPDLLFRSQSGKLWVTCWYENFVSKVTVGASPEAGGAWARWDILNQSLSGTVYRLTTPSGNPSFPNVCVWPMSDSQQKGVTLFTEFLILGVIGLALWPRARDQKDSDQYSFITFGQVGIVLSGMLLLSPMSSKHHFCALVVPLTFCVIHYAYQRRDRVVGVGLGLVFVLGTLGAKDIVGDAIGDRLQAFGGLTICTFVCLIITSWAVVIQNESELSDKAKGEETNSGREPHRTLKAA